MKNYSKVKLKQEKLDMKNAEVRKTSGLRGGFAESDRHWYDLPEKDVAGSISQIIAQIDNNNKDIRDQYERNANLYGNYANIGINNWMQVGYGGDSGSNNYPVYNVIQSSVDTIHSKIARDNPKPYFITSGADYFVKLRAEWMTQFVQGIFQDTNLYDIANNQVFRDASVQGLGGLQFSLNKETNKIETEWVFIDEIKVDRLDGHNKKPRSIHRSRVMHKEVVEEKFKDKLDVIRQVCDDEPQYFKGRDTVVDFLVITDSWHLRNGDKPGRHVISILDKVLLDEEYDEDWYPIVFFRYMDNMLGFWGRGIAETLLPNQIEINKILLMIQQAQELQCSPYIAVENGSEISDDVLLSNNISRKIPYRSGTNPPAFISPTGLSEEIYTHLQWWITSSYQEIGISQTSVNGTKQSGVNSAVAMRTMVDIESSRFIQVSKNWEKFFVDCATVVMRLGKKAYIKNPSFKITYMDKKSKILKEIPWSKIDSADDMFKIQCDTISSFPSSAAGRIQTITDYISNNFISKERGIELLGLDPDLEGEVKLQTSSLRLCEKRLCQMVEDNIYNHPDARMNLKLALQVSEATYNQLVIDECPEERLALVRNWMDEIIAMITGQDPQVQALQQVFAPPAPPPQAPQAGIQPANQQPQQAAA